MDILDNTVYFFAQADYFGFGEFTVRNAYNARSISTYNATPFDDFRKNRALAGAVKETRMIGSDNIEYTRTKYTYTIREITPQGAPPLPETGEPARSFFIEPTAVETRSRGVLTKSVTSHIELEPGEYALRSKTASVTDHYSDDANAPVTVTNYEEFTNIASTNETRIIRKVNLAGLPQETTAQYAYDNAGNLTEERVAYTGSGLAPAGDRVIHYDYDEYGNRTRITDASGAPARIKETLYDEALHQFVVEERAIGDAVTLVSRYTINYGIAFGGIERTTDPNGKSVYFEYDGYGRLSRERVDTDTGPAVTNVYDYSSVMQFPLSVKAAQNTGTGSLIETRVYADGMGRIIHSIQSAGNDAAGKRYVRSGLIAYDYAGRVIQQGQPEYAEDDEINRYRKQSRIKNPTRTDYDGAGRVKMVTLPQAEGEAAPAKISYIYTDPWEVTSTTSAGRSKRIIKNARGLTLSVEEWGTGDDGTTARAKIGFAYDAAGRRILKKDLNTSTINESVSLSSIPAKDTSGNNAAFWQYDGMGRLIAASDPDLGVSRFTYSAFSEITAKTDALNRTTNYSYDRLGRLREKELPGTEGTVRYIYDSYAGCTNGLGRLVVLDDPAQRKIMSYDALGRVKREIREMKPIAGGRSESFVTDYGYDLLGRKREIVYPADPVTGKRVVVKYTHSSMGVTGVTIDKGDGIEKEIVQSIEYDEFGQMTTVKRGNGAVTLYSYDVKRRLKNLLTYTYTNGKWFKAQDVNYTFSIDDNIKAIEKFAELTATGAYQNRIRYSYSYDGLSRLVNARGDYTKAGGINTTLDDDTAPESRAFLRGFSYAANGNLTSKSILDPQSGSNTDKWNYIYSNHAVNSIATTAGRSFTMRYDASGNMTLQRDSKESRAKEMSYTHDNRIKRVIDPQTGTVAGEYTYDDQGFRVRKVIRKKVEGVERCVAVVNPSMYMSFERVLDGGGCRTTGGKSGAVSHIYLNGIRIAALTGDGKAEYYLTDQVSSVTATLDDAGMVLSRTEYMPYGKTWFQDDKTGEEGKHTAKYNSQLLDKETGFYFYNARHYDPEVGRFVTADSVVDGEASTQGWNRYMYVKGNPVRYSDPTGNLFEEFVNWKNDKGWVDNKTAAWGAKQEKNIKDTFQKDKRITTEKKVAQMQARGLKTDKLEKRLTDLRKKYQCDRALTSVQSAALKQYKESLSDASAGGKKGERLLQGANALNQNGDRSMAGAGCYFRSLQAVAEEYAGENLTADKINAARKDLSAGNKPALGSDTSPVYVNDSNRVINDAFRRLGRSDLTATVDSGGNGAKRNYTLIRGVNSKGTHYRLGDAKGSQLWNPAPGTPVIKGKDRLRDVYIHGAPAKNYSSNAHSRQQKIIFVYKKIFLIN